MRFTPKEVELLVHRFQSGCIAECLECEGFSAAEVDAAIEDLTKRLTSEIDPAAMSRIDREIIWDAFDGSTWLAAREGAWQDSEISDQALSAAVRVHQNLGVKLRGAGLDCSRMED